MVMILAFCKSEGISLSCQILHMSSFSLLARLNLKISAGVPSGPQVLWFFICIVAHWTSCRVGRIYLVIVSPDVVEWCLLFLGS